jgi:hypothetical protein
MGVGMKVWVVIDMDGKIEGVYASELDADRQISGTSSRKVASFLHYSERVSI